MIFAIIKSVICFIIIFINITTYADIYFMKFKNRRDESLYDDTRNIDLSKDSYDFAESKLDVFKKYDEKKKKFIQFKLIPFKSDETLKNLLQIINNINDKNKINNGNAYKRKCERHFGSVYGTKMQKLLCLRDAQDNNMRYKRSRDVDKIRNSFANALNIESIDKNTIFHKLDFDYDDDDENVPDAIPIVEKGSSKSVSEPNLKNFDLDYLDAVRTVNNIPYTDIEIPLNIRLFGKHNLKFMHPNKSIKVKKGVLSKSNIRQIFNNKEGKHVKDLQFSYDYINVPDDDHELKQTSHLISKKDKHTSTVVNKSSRKFGEQGSIITEKEKNNIIKKQYPENDSVENNNKRANEKKSLRAKRFKIVEDTNINKKLKVQEYDESNSADSASAMNEKETESDSSTEGSTEDTGSSENEMAIKIDIETQKASSQKEADDDSEYIYVQGPRHIKLSDLNGRRRLKHFLPKRYYWDESDFKNLGYLWFNGPQGKYAGPWRLPY